MYMSDNYRQSISFACCVCQSVLQGHVLLVIG